LAPVTKVIGGGILATLTSADGVGKKIAVPLVELGDCGNNQPKPAESRIPISLTPPAVEIIAQAQELDQRVHSPAAGTVSQMESLFPGNQHSAPVSPYREFMVGGDVLYTVKKSDTLKSVGARFRVSPQYLAKINGIDWQKHLSKGQVLKIVDRHIIPKRVTDGLVINIADCTLYYFRGGKLVTAIPVAVGKPKSKTHLAWHTPVGDFRIIAKTKDPTWRVPPSIQKEMEARGSVVVAEIPPGPANPLGKFAMRTSIPGILIHSTTAPGSIYGFNSHGCIRVNPSQIEELFNNVRMNTTGEIIYRPVKLAVTDGGKVFLEVHGDAYEKMKSIPGEVQREIKKQNLGKRIDWKKVERTVMEKSGIAEDISI
jgi:L,D-transpeptidase ErfK/SrfK